MIGLRNIILEINSRPERLDLHGRLIRAAKAKGCRFTIDTDAHRPQHLHDMRYSVTTARRGWLEATHVLNTRPPGRIRSRPPPEH